LRFCFEGVAVLVFKILVSCEEPDGIIQSCDAINYKDGIWLVPQWLEDSANGLAKPVRIVRVDQFGLQPTTLAGNYYVLAAKKLSRAVLEGRMRPRPQDEVVESPDIEIELASI
jgi:hypothetical protein